MAVFQDSEEVLCIIKVLLLWEGQFQSKSRGLYEYSLPWSNITDSRPHSSQWRDKLENIQIRFGEKNQKPAAAQSQHAFMNSA